MNTELLNALKEIIAKQGDSVLSDHRRVLGFLADMASDVPKPQKNALVKCLEYGYAQTLKDTPETERAGIKQRLAQKLHEEEGLDLGVCGQGVDVLAAALFGEEVPKVYCNNCKKEIQEEWKSCPFCGTAVGAPVTPISGQTPAATTQAVQALLNRGAAAVEVSALVPGSIILLGSGSGSWGYGISLIKPADPSNIVIPDGVTYIGDFAFAGSKLIGVTIPYGVTHIGAGAFFKNQLTSVAIPNGVTHIGESAFCSNQLTSVAIPNSVTHIGAGAFLNNQLTSVAIPDSVTRIGEYAFRENQLTRITIGSNVSIGKDAFDHGFAKTYQKQGCRAGTYIFQPSFFGGKWVYEG